MSISLFFLFVTLSNIYVHHIMLKCIALTYFFHKKAAKAHNDKQYYIYLGNPCLLHLAICMLNLISFVFSLLLKSHEIVIKANKNKAPLYEIDISI